METGAALLRHKVDRADLPTAREIGLNHHLRGVKGLERPGGLPFDEILKLEARRRR